MVCVGGGGGVRVTGNNNNSSNNNSVNWPTRNVVYTESYNNNQANIGRLTGICATKTSAGGVRLQWTPLADTKGVRYIVKMMQRNG